MSWYKVSYPTLNLPNFLIDIETKWTQVKKNSWFTGYTEGNFGPKRETLKLVIGFFCKLTQFRNWFDWESQERSLSSSEYLWRVSQFAKILMTGLDVACFLAEFFWWNSSGGECLEMKLNGIIVCSFGV